MIDLHYVEQGQGQPVVLVHGWSQSTRCFAKQLAGLSAHYRVIAVDMRGHGESPKPSHGYRVARLAQDLHEFLARLDLRNVALVGHSMGSSVIWSYLEQYGAERVAKLIFIDQAPLVTNGRGLSGAALADAGCAFTPTTLYEIATALVSQREATLQGLRSAFFSAAVGDEDFAMAVNESLKIPAEYAARLLIDHASQDWRDVIGQVIPSLKLPTLVFGGELASIFPPQAAAWIAAQIPGAELSIFGREEGGSHFMFWENPEKFNAVLRRFIG
jgi:non-heme chloroperoxidase